ncbi:hypothetical protein EVAR_35589_1 [Eumeta japonica]|uniref:Uncharacterized protein n=1 Tax=Eumeta variegata TaxID=151549 RepID=A0A4C1XM60_EUMVA|nr:hypothetical protein EVAR_35589_1 [Eumeta japonica]
MSDVPGPSKRFSTDDSSISVAKKRRKINQYSSLDENRCGDHVVLRWLFSNRPMTISPYLIRYIGEDRLATQQITTIFQPEIVSAKTASQGIKHVIYGCIEDNGIKQVKEFVYWDNLLANDDTHYGDIERRLNLGNIVNGAQLAVIDSKKVVSCARPKSLSDLSTGARDRLTKRL